jgi:hypothetical protein
MLCALPYSNVIFFSGLPPINGDAMSFHADSVVVLGSIKHNLTNAVNQFDVRF